MIKKVTAGCAATLLLLTIGAHAQTQGCRPRKQHSVSCDDGNGCKRTVILSDCSGPTQWQQTNSTLAGYCCGSEYYRCATWPDPCGTGGGGAELRNAPEWLKYQLVTPTCKGFHANTAIAKGERRG